MRTGDSATSSFFGSDIDLDGLGLGGYQALHDGSSVVGSVDHDGVHGWPGDAAFDLEEVLTALHTVRRDIEGIEDGAARRREAAKWSSEFVVGKMGQ